MVELALVAPVFILLVLGLADLALAFRAHMILVNAAYEGARYGAVGNPPGQFPADCLANARASVVGRVCTAVAGLDLSAMEDVSVSYPVGEGPGNPIVVTARYRHHFVTPLAPFLRALTGERIAEFTELCASSDMRLE